MGHCFKLWAETMGIWCRGVEGENCEGLGCRQSLQPHRKGRREGGSTEAGAMPPSPEHRPSRGHTSRGRQKGE